MHWSTRSYTFVATSTQTTLSFTSTTEDGFGPVIDNIVITENERLWRLAQRTKPERLKRRRVCRSELPNLDRHPQSRSGVSGW